MLALTKDLIEEKIVESMVIYKREEELGIYIGTNCPQVETLTETE